LIGVVLIHGMGQQQATFANRLIQRVRHRIGDLIDDPDVVEFQPVWWASLLNRRSDDLWARMTSRARLDWKRTRMFVLGSMGDAAAYQRLPSEDTDIYRECHAVIADALANLERRLKPSAPVIVVAHSLGSYIVSNYIWDRQHDFSVSAVEARTPSGHPPRSDPSLSDFQKLKTLIGLVTYGSNIPVLTLGYKKIEPIRFPEVGELRARLAALRPGITDEEIRDVAKWGNFYDHDDVLGWPLKPLSERYSATVDDHQVNAGLLYGFTPLSHVAYERNRTVLDYIARLVCSVLRLVSSGRGSA